MPEKILRVILGGACHCPPRPSTSPSPTSQGRGGALRTPEGIQVFGPLKRRAWIQVRICRAHGANNRRLFRVYTTSLRRFVVQAGEDEGKGITIESVLDGCTQL